MALLRPKVTVSVANKAALLRAIEAKAVPVLEREAEQIGREMVDECVRIVQAETERRPVDRRKVNTTHLDQSFEHRVDRTGGRIRSVLTIKSGVNKAKVGALEYGIKHQYVIAPRNAPALSWKDKNGLRVTKKRGQPVIRQPKAGTTEYDGVGMMRRARERVVRRRRNARV
jgi:hypothetical protein